MQYHQEPQYFFDPWTHSLVEHRNSSIPVLSRWVVIKNRDHFLFLQQEQKYGKELQYRDGEVISVVHTLKGRHSYEYIRRVVLSNLNVTLDECAQSLGYERIEEAISYAEDPSDMQFQTEGRSLRYWRSQCRRICIDMIEEIYQRQLPIPRRYDVEKLLPAFEIQPIE